MKTATKRFCQLQSQISKLGYKLGNRLGYDK